MELLRNIPYLGEIELEVLAAEYCVSSTRYFPCGNCKIRIWLKADGSYYGVPNVYPRAEENGNGCCADGSTPEEALHGVMDQIISKVNALKEKYGEQLDDNLFQYVAPNAF